MGVAKNKDSDQLGNEYAPDLGLCFLLSRTFYHRVNNKISPLKMFVFRPKS